MAEGELEVDKNINIYIQCPVKKINIKEKKCVIIKKR